MGSPRRARQNSCSYQSSSGQHQLQRPVGRAPGGGAGHVFSGACLLCSNPCGMHDVSNDVGNTAHAIWESPEVCAGVPSAHRIQGAPQLVHTDSSGVWFVQSIVLYLFFYVSLIHLLSFLNSTNIILAKLGHSWIQGQYTLKAFEESSHASTSLGHDR